MGKAKAINSSDIQVGKPLDWDIYDRNGRLLLKRGMSVQSAKQLTKIMAYGAQRILEDQDQQQEGEEAEKSDALSPFDNIAKAVKEIAAVYATILKHVANKDSNIQTRILSLASYLIELCEYDLDATLGAIHLEKQYPYAVIHPINSAILCNVMADLLELDIKKRLSLISAAITANIGMFGLQQKLIAQAGPLSEEQEDKVKKHPLNSAVLLKHWGVNDRLWLEIVMQHHEKHDGTGYPRRLAGNKFIMEARILGIADRYHALLAPREYRKGLLPTQALSQLFKGRGQEVDEGLTVKFVKELGIYPPGTFVRLRNGDTAIVTRRGEDRMRPVVKSIINERGASYPVPLRRETHQQLLVNEITGMCQPPKKVVPKFSILWDYEL